MEEEFRNPESRLFIGTLDECGVPKLDNQHGFIMAVMSLGILEISSSCITWESQCLEISFLQLITKTCSNFPQIGTTEMAVDGFL